jgi:hypothetical protein
MRQSRFTAEQLVTVLRRVEARAPGTKVRALLRRRLMLLGAFFVLPAFIACGGRSSAQNDHGSTAAIPNRHPSSDSLTRLVAGGPLQPADFAISGLHLGMDSGMVRHMLGAPDSSAQIPEQRDPGATGTVWVYGQLTVLFSPYDGVGALEITGPLVATPRGLHVGDSAHRVRELYGAPASEDDSDWQYESDRVDPNVMIVLFKKGTVERIYLGAIRD